MDKVKTAVVGLGSRGYMMLGLLTGMDNCIVTEVCDIYADRVAAAQDLVEQQTGVRPFGCTDYREVIARRQIDALLCITGWEDHVKICVDCMKAGIPVATEVGGAYTVEDCFTLVSVQESTKTPFFFLENCCYGEYELMVLNMVRRGLFGEVVHCDGGYMHDLRTEVLFGRENRHYRLKNYTERNCENYPTHELGPIARVLDINRGNRMLYLTSVASKSAGLNDYAKLHENVRRELCDTRFAQGDVVSTNIVCASGATVSLTLDTTLPRPYSRNFTVRGTRGMYREDGNYIYLDTDFDESSHFNWTPQWNNAAKYLEKYEHPIWRKFKDDGVRGGHGGMDYLVYNEFFECVKNDTPPKLDVYDGAALMCITPLSAQSIASGGAPVEIPDFTHGAWKTRKNGEIEDI